MYVIIITTGLLLEGVRTKGLLSVVLLNQVLDFLFDSMDYGGEMVTNCLKNWIYNLRYSAYNSIFL